MKRQTARFQGLYFALGGLWPLLNIRSFERVSGPKTDRWLVKTVATLLTSVGIGLLRAARRDRIAPEISMIGVGTAASLAAVDLVYVSKRRISPVYLLDAVVNLWLIRGWLRAGA